MGVGETLVFATNQIIDEWETEALEVFRYRRVDETTIAVDIFANGEDLDVASIALVDFTMNVYSYTMTGQQIIKGLDVSDWFSKLENGDMVRPFEFISANLVQGETVWPLDEKVKAIYYF